MRRLPLLHEKPASAGFFVPLSRLGADAPGKHVWLTGPIYACLSAPPMGNERMTCSAVDANAPR
jgi:hypothetical protein